MENITVIPITSMRKNLRSNERLLEANDINGLSHNSKLLFGQVTTLSSEKIGRFLGEIDSEEMKMIIEQLTSIFQNKN